MKSSTIDMKTAGFLLPAILAWLPVACTKEDRLPETFSDREEKVAVRIEIFGGAYDTRAMEAEENLISDLNILVFSESEALDEQIYLDRRTLQGTTGPVSRTLCLLREPDYHIRVCANFGYHIRGVRTLTEMENYRFHLAYPDDYAAGIPMTGRFDGSLRDGKQTLPIPLERMMAKVSVRMDRSRLDKGVRLRVHSLEIRQCPKSACAFGKSRAESALDVFKNGFFKSGREVDALNRDWKDGLSEETAAYMLENMQGDLLPEAKRSKDKILDSPTAAERCSYMELKIEYLSDRFSTRPEEFLHYRFYLGEGPGNFDTERNCHYRYTLRPAGTGLDGGVWRVDKRRLRPRDGGPDDIPPE